VKLEAEIGALSEGLGAASAVAGGAGRRRCRAAGALCRRRAGADARASDERGGNGVAAAEEAARLRAEQTEQAGRLASSRCERAQAVVSEREGSIPAPLRDPAALARAIAQAKQKLQQLATALQRAQETCAAARQRWSACEATARTAAETAATAATRRRPAYRLCRPRARRRLAELADYQAAKRSSDDIEILDLEIRKHEGSLQAARERMQRATEAAAGLTAPHLPQLTAELAAAKQAHEQALGEEASLPRNASRCRAGWRRSPTNAARLKALEARYAVVGRIADVANGNNARRITFQRFVLASLLDDVLRVATKRLQG